MKSLSWFFLAAAFVLVGCEAPPHREAAEPASATASSQQASSQKNAAEHSHGKTGHGNHEGCAHEHGKAGTDDTIRKGKDPRSGAELTLVGADLAGLEVVSVKKLVENPDAYSGKNIRVEGDISTMCHHRRGWFAVQDEGARTGAFVRIVTNPVFLVPAGSIGKKARVEGKVEVVEESASTVRYLARGHNLGDDKEIAGSVKRVLIRAAGAEIF